MGAVLSYVPEPLETLVEEWWAWSVCLLRFLIVRGVSLATGKGELERICGRDKWHSSSMSKRFLRSLRLSSSSSSITPNPASPSLLFRPMPFDTPTVLAALITQHHIPPSMRLVRENLTHCLEALNYANAVAAHTIALSKTPFDYSNNEHLRLLVGLWKALKPDTALPALPAVAAAATAPTATAAAAAAAAGAEAVAGATGSGEEEKQKEGGKEGGKKEEGNTISSNSTEEAATAAAPWKEADRSSTSQWNELGFQGKDPATDLRGMGLLGLMQLVYYAERYPEKARSTLLESEHPRRWFPWAVAGINVSSFVVALLVDERVLDGKLVEEREEEGEEEEEGGREMRDEGVGKERELGVRGRKGGEEKGMKVVNEAYCRVWEEMGRAWVEADAENVMAFPRVWGEVKRRERRRWRRRGEDLLGDLMQW